MTPPRILMMIDQFHPIVGGAEQQALRLCRRLIAHGYEVSVLTRQVREELAPEENFEGIRIYRLAVQGVSGLAKIRSSIPATRWLIQNRDRYDLIHCHGVNPLEWSALFASLVTRRPYLVKIPLSNFLNFAGEKKGFNIQSASKSSLVKRLLKPLALPVLRFFRVSMLRRASRAVAISPEIRANLEAHRFANIANIPNGIDTNAFQPVSAAERTDLRKHLSLPQDSTVFVFTGRLAVEKNVRTLLQAWDLFTQQPDFAGESLILLGSGHGQNYSNEAELREFAAQRGLATVEFRGSVSNVRDYLMAADAFILPSLWEGMSNSLLEAMASGLAIIASDIDGNRNLVSHGESALLFPPTDAEALQECLKSIASNGTLRVQLGQTARQRAVEHFSLDHVCKRYMDEYSSILA